MTAVAQTLVLPSYRGDSRAVFVVLSARPCGKARQVLKCGEEQRYSRARNIKKIMHIYIK